MYYKNTGHFYNTLNQFINNSKKQKKMNANLKTALIVLAALVVFKIADQLFLDSAISKVTGHFEEE